MSVEVILRNLSRGGESGYDLMAKDARKLFLEKFDMKMADKHFLSYNNGVITVNMFSRDYHTDIESGEVTSDCGAVSGTEKLTVYDLIADSDSLAFPSGELVSLPMLSTMHNSRSYAGEGMFEPTVKAWDGRTDELAKAIRSLGGEEYGKGDAAYRLPFVGGMYAALSYYCSDDEFPASLTLYFDRNAIHFMHYETVWYAAGIMLRRINENM